MAKTNKRRHNLLAILCMLPGVTLAQAKSGMESYNFLSRTKEYVWMPVLHYQSEKGLYTEVRYNYEDVQTLSLYAGKIFSAGNDLSCSITPMIGISTGNFSGASVAANAEADWKNLYVSTQTQFSMATKKGIANFFFSWSELGYNISRNIFAGLAVQYTRQGGINYTEPGFVAGLNFKNFSIPLYVFKPFSPDQYIILGLNFECRIKKRK